MIDAVSDARIRADVHTTENVVAPAASTRPAFAACARPRLLSSMSADPCHLAAAFHRLCPWRTTRSEESALCTVTRVPATHRSVRVSPVVIGDLT